MHFAGQLSVCPVCGGLKLKELFTIDLCRYVKCSHCHLVWMNPLIKAEMTGDDYENLDWDLYNQFVYKLRIYQFQKDLGVIKKIFPQGGCLLDIGTGTGEFLTIAAAQGFTPYGIEPSKKARRLAAGRNRVIQGEFENISLREDFFDVVTCWSVLEHILQPEAFLLKVSRILKKGGLLALRLPLASSLLHYLSLWLYFLSGRKITWPLRQFYQLDWHSKHFFLFSESNLFWLLKKTNFQPIWRQKEPGFDLASLEYRLTFRPKVFLEKELLFICFRFILFLSRFLKKEDELVVLAKKI